MTLTKNEAVEKMQALLRRAGELSAERLALRVEVETLCAEFPSRDADHEMIQTFRQLCEEVMQAVERRALEDKAQLAFVARYPDAENF